MEWIKKVENFVFGAECMGCHNPSGNLDPWLCPKCRASLKEEGALGRFPNPDTISLYPMHPLTRKLIHGLKYHSLPGMAMYLVKFSGVKNGPVFEAFEMLPKPLYFVPVPLHPARYRERGYNQAEKIAGALATVFGGKVCKWLKRKRFVTSQTKLSKVEREKNVAEAFVSNLPKEIPLRGTAIIVDDVFTTGATTSSCISALGKNFPLMVKVCTLLYDEPASVAADYAADISAPWDVEWEYTHTR